jgi:D-alanine-D-alanine ligase-like ATP-grasp enzyme
LFGTWRYIWKKKKLLKLQFSKGTKKKLKPYFFQRYIKERSCKVDFRGKILPKIKELIMISMESVKEKINMNNRSYCFEIFGYDFIIDASGKVWLIEVNTNPCLEESSPLLKRIIPRMIGLNNHIRSIFLFDYLFN